MDNKDTLKIGIVLNYKQAEKKKEELFPIDMKEKPWLKKGHEVEYSKHVIIKKGKKYVPGDVAIGLYIESNYPNVKVDYITPDEVSTRRFNQNNLVFIIIYDLLEAFHLTKKKENFNRFKLALKNSTNVYPPYQYQKFINNKCDYYKYLGKKGLPVAPTHCISREKWYKRNPNVYVSNLLAKVHRNNWESIIAKPVYGQESIGFAKFMACRNNTLECRKERLMRYLSENIPKYKSIIIQEYIKGFDKNNPEFRMFFINGDYMYCIITGGGNVEQPVQEGGKFKIPDSKWEEALSLAKRTVRELPKLDLSNQTPVLTRVDIGSGLVGVPEGLFINEVEFVPSMYIEDQNNPVIEKISDALVDIAKEYKNKGKKSVKVTF